MKRRRRRGGRTTNKENKRLLLCNKNTYKLHPNSGHSYRGPWLYFRPRSLSQIQQTLLNLPHPTWELKTCLLNLLEPRASRPITDGVRSGPASRPPVRPMAMRPHCTSLGKRPS